MEQLVYLTDSYKKELDTTIESIITRKGKTYLLLAQTIFYPVGGGQPSDTGEIKGKSGQAKVLFVKMEQGRAIHEVHIIGKLEEGHKVHCVIDWGVRYANMRRHSAGHLIHDAIIRIYPSLVPLKGEHGHKASITYQGSIPIGEKSRIEQAANEFVSQNLDITTEFVPLEELKKRASFVPATLPTGKPLRIITIGANASTADGGTQVKRTGEIGPIEITNIDNTDETVTVSYRIDEKSQEPQEKNTIKQETDTSPLTIPEFTGQLLDTENDIKDSLDLLSPNEPLPVLKERILGKGSVFSNISQKIREISKENRSQAGIVLNETKARIVNVLEEKYKTQSQTAKIDEWFDPTVPGIKPPLGHLHVVSLAIDEITTIFAKIGFTRVRHPEIDWDWYPFEALNMPPNHPARDEWETYFITYPGKPSSNPKKQKVVLTPHTSNGQVREMEKGKLPIRMINIAKCYRRQIDVSHTPMFHQFEGLYVDKHVSIAHLKGVLEYFVKQFFGENRTSRIRPFHFQFTEPSFEIDISCGVCQGTGKLINGMPCKLCKSGWLELGGAGMVHPVVLQNGGIDPGKYSGFAFGWGIERTYMMKSGTQLDDIRLLYSNDVRFLEQF